MTDPSTFDPPCPKGLHDLADPANRMPTGTRIGGCRACHNAAYALSERNKRAARRKLFLEMYGGRCACCEIEREVFLTLDHVQNDGAADRKLPGGDQGVFKRAVASHQPDRYQILCFNCNLAKARDHSHTCS